MHEYDIGWLCENTFHYAVGSFRDSKQCQQFKDMLIKTSTLYLLNTVCTHWQGGFTGQSLQWSSLIYKGETRWIRSSVALTTGIPAKYKCVTLVPILCTVNCGGLQCVKGDIKLAATLCCPLSAASRDCDSTDTDDLQLQKKRERTLKQLKIVRQKHLMKMSNSNNIILEGLCVFIIFYLWQGYYVFAPMCLLLFSRKSQKLVKSFSMKIGGKKVINQRTIY